MYLYDKRRQVVLGVVLAVGIVCCLPQKSLAQAIRGTQNYRLAILAPEFRL